MRELDPIVLLVAIALSAWASIAAIIAAADEQSQRLQIQKLEAEAALAASQLPKQITLDLTPEAMNICKRLFVRYTQGGHVDEYRCELKSGAIVLIGPNWRKAHGNTAPTEVLGREELK